jgi:FkbM family methyltransferase
MPNSWLRKYIARNRRHPLVQHVAQKCASFLEAYHNADYDFESNGELFVLRCLARFPVTVVFDVGANIGDWTHAAATAFPDAAIYSFEICQETFKRLVERTAGLKGVHRVKTGLADREGTVNLHYYADVPALTTVLDFPHGYASTQITEAITTGDQFCAVNGISHIDLLKIDVEGMDHLVLQGFEGLIQARGVDVIQFEYGQGNILSKFLLHDFCEFFSRRGYVVGKIFPNYVDFRDHAMADENFIGPNFLACRREKQAYIEALRGGAWR